MNFTDIPQFLDDSIVGTAIRQSGVLFPTIESVHVLMIAVVIGTIAIVDLRLIGYASHRRGARQLIIDLLPFTWAAFVMAGISGFLLFTSNAVAYLNNKPFEAKMCVLVLAGINMLIFHLTAYRKIGHWDDDKRPPIGAQISGAISLSLWLLIMCLGRWIGFTLD